MTTPVRAGARAVGRGAGATADTPSYSGTMSGYGTKRADSVGYNPANPYAYTATTGAKTYKNSKGTTDWDGPNGIFPPIK